MRVLHRDPHCGRLRICSTTGFGRRIVGPLLTSFRAKYPDIAIDFWLQDIAPDLTANRIDIAFCDDRMDDARIVARQLIPMQLHVCASAAYARELGLPRTVDELSGHRCINVRTASGRVAEWEFKTGGVSQKTVPRALLTFNDPDLVLQSVLDGEGIAQLPAYQASVLLRERRLLACLAQYAPDDRGHYACYRMCKQLPPHVSVLLDYMTVRIRALDLSSSI
ncbi:substrate binding domain-containing protein [Paraburkholderia nodosa]|uniref:substrate binding domain-containing protein n=1 Tax=Paraburkholderia nodosa TaxID=392320 RepID=UPI00210C2FDB|nr:substrate binding domain-containing protein [Paraburkholderia nodosa]